MADFKQAVEKLLKMEGGFAERDNRAGAVNFGITQQLLKQLGRPHAVEDVRNLTREEAILIYQHEFWDKLHIGEIQDQRIAEAYFFAVVNMGPRFPSLYLQESLRELGNPLLVDGIVGPVVRAQLNALSVEEATIVLTKFLDRLRTRYELLAKVSPEYADDLPGWKARLEA